MKRTQPGESQCLTMSVPAAGWRYYGLGRNGSYALAKERPDLMPTIVVRGKKRVPVPVMDEIIERAPADSTASED
jgi:hypothetical protein